CHVALLRRFAHARDHLAIETQHVPMQRVERLHRTVGEAVQNVERQLAAVKTAQQSAAAFGAQVEGQNLLRGGHATSSGYGYCSVGCEQEQEKVGGREKKTGLTHEAVRPVGVRRGARLTATRESASDRREC